MELTKQPCEKSAEMVKNAQHEGAARDSRSRTERAEISVSVLRLRIKLGEG